MDHNNYVVVGAGPASAAVTLALVEKGLHVTVLDSGLTLEADKEAARKRLSEQLPSDWRPADLDAVRYDGVRGNGLAVKYLFGSDVGFREDGALPVDKNDDVGAVPSYAYGGLSTVWGAGLLSYTADDMSNWPLGPEDLQHHAAGVLKHLPYSAAHDELEQLYPMLREPDGVLVRSGVAERIMARLRDRSEQLDSAGYAFGGARLAVRTGRPAPEAGCIYCRHCLNGCPYGHIYNAAFSFDELRRVGAIDYRRNVHVQRVTEHDGIVSVEAIALEDRSPIQLQAERVFIGAGALGTTAILQQSQLIAPSVEMLDSQTIFVPMLWTGKTDNIHKVAGYTLAQMFLIIHEASVSPRPVHVSLYTYNDGLLDRAHLLHPQLSSALGPVLDRIAHRLVVAICFLHSDDSHRVVSSVAPDSKHLTLRALPNPRTEAVISRFHRSLVHNLAPVGLIPLTFLTERAPAGGGFHYGGTVPMRLHPRPGEADLLGRPFGADKIHAIDASLFPDIPGGTITLPAMANARRIALAAIDEDKV